MMGTLQQNVHASSADSNAADSVLLPATSFVRNGMNAPLSNSQCAAFFIDTVSLFSGVLRGHMGRWLYSERKNRNDEVRGSKLWSQFVLNSLTFYMHSADLMMLSLVLDDILNHVPEGTSLIDFGPGSAEAFKLKSLALIRKIKPDSYYPIDFCGEFLTSSGKILGKRIADGQIDWPITIEAIRMDFFNRDRLIETDARRTSLLFMGGGTIANLPHMTNDNSFPKAAYINYLKQLYGATVGDAYLLLPFDTNQDRDSLLASYSDNIYAKWMENLPFRIKRDLPIQPLERSGFKPHAFRYEPQWCSKKNLLAHTLVVTEQQIFKLASTPFELNVGDRLYINNSYKIPRDTMVEIASKANWDVVAEYPVSDKKYTGILFKKGFINGFSK